MLKEQEPPARQLLPGEGILSPKGKKTPCPSVNTTISKVTGAMETKKQTVKCLCLHTEKCSLRFKLEQKRWE